MATITVYGISRTMIPIQMFGDGGKTKWTRPPSKEPDTTRLYRWHWRARMPERHGTLYRVLARGSLNSCLIEFVSDQWRVVTTRNALRVARP